MGLLSSITKFTGIARDKLGSAIGTLRRTATRIAPRLTKGAIRLGGVAKGGVTRLLATSRTARIVLGVGKFALRRLGPVGVALTAFGAAKFLISRKKKKQTLVASAVGAAGSVVAVKKRLDRGKIAMAAGGLAAAAFVGEQLAESAGVRGGAGFIGRRKTPKAPSRQAATGKRARRKAVRKATRTTRRRKRTTCPPRRRRSGRAPGRTVSFTTADGRRVRFKTKSTRSQARKIKRTKRRKGKGIAKTELRAIRALIREAEQD